MSQEVSDRFRTAPSYSHEWDPRYARLPARTRHGSSTLLLAGLAAVGVGAVLWNYLGPDLRRYLKIRSM
jgi:hypothetical protein